MRRALIVEIGFGNADYLIALAKANRDASVIGFEVSSQSLDKAHRKIANQGINNAMAVYSRGETALHHLFKPNSIREIHINFPDPWFKSRHTKRRLMQRDTVDAIVSRLIPGGLLYLATDIVEYAQMSHELLAETAGLDNQLPAPWVNQLPERLLTTKYEERGFNEGRPGHYFKYRRNDKPALDIPVKEDLDVPHCVIRTPMPPQEIAKLVEKTSHHHGDDIHVALMSAYWNPKYNNVIFEVMIEEATIDQHIAIAMTTREEAEEYTIKYATFGMPRPTRGMHVATNFLADWVTSLHPDARVMMRNLQI